MIGVLGGTFDPIHHGHLRVALEVKEMIGLDEVRFIPLYRAVHRDQPIASGKQRLRMIQAAISDQAYFVVDDSRVLWLSELIDQLRQVGFQGVISLQPNYGNYCLSKSETGGFVLAKSSEPFEDCIFSQSTENKGFAQSSYQTLAFANYLSALDTNRTGGIEVQLEADQYEKPLVIYPEKYTVNKAGEWNRIAGQNQRVIVKLFER